MDLYDALRKKRHKLNVSVVKKNTAGKKVKKIVPKKLKKGIWPILAKKRNRTLNFVDKRPWLKAKLKLWTKVRKIIKKKMN